MMKPHIKLIYCISKISGLISFQINKQSGLVEETQSSFSYFVIFGAFIQALTLYAFHHLYFGFLSTFYNEGIRVLVLRWELVLILFKSLTSYSLNLFYHNDTVRLINQMISFGKVLKNVSDRQNFIDDILMRQYIVRYIAFIIQAVISLSSFMFLEYKLSEFRDNLSWTVTVFNHISSLIVPSMSFYGGLIITSRFLRILNDNLEILISTNERNVVDGSTVSSDSTIFHLDQFGIFFRKFSSITDKLFHIYQFQILLTLIVSSGFTLSSVTRLFDNLINLIKFKILKDLRCSSFST